MITFMLYENAPFNINNIPLFLEGRRKEGQIRDRMGSRGLRTGFMTAKRCLKE